MSTTWATCPTCSQPLYPATARRTDDGWACADTRRCTNRRRANEANAARREDVAWLAETGEIPERAAARIGISTEALERWCQRHAPELWARLMRNGRAA